MSRNTLIYKDLRTTKNIRCYLKDFRQKYKIGS